jgi:uncharacterized membrane protein
MYNDHLEDYIFYNVNDIFTMALAFKVLWYVRNVFMTSKYGSDRTVRVCRMFGADPGLMFSLKSFHKDNAKFCVFALFIAGGMFFGWMIMIAESPMNRRTKEMDHTRLFTSVWAAIVTMTTVGYGDMYPRTDLGRFIMVCCSIYGVVTVSVMVVTLTNELEMSSMELQSWTVMKKLEWRTKLQQKAVGLIVTISRNRDEIPKHLRHLKGKDIKHKKLEQLARAVREFREVRRNYKFAGGLNTSEQIAMSTNKIIDNVTECYDLLCAHMFGDLLRKSDSENSDGETCEEKGPEQV